MNNKFDTFILQFTKNKKGIPDFWSSMPSFVLDFS